ncbi:uncharacterized protein LOC118801075 [Colossoma macropomum]|uniref:uncharacterized protein LOC118801075 n=1 Tax=Colossoma macropomum TaxID=42526 RepID=UPI0018651B77|nr:uncharacterized protein LOC118801075 [Colossoma macropomum]
MAEAVDRLCLLQFVLIQALLLTVCSSESNENYVKCQDINGTVGKPLNLTCKITDDQNCKCTLYKWKKNGTELKKDTDCEKNLTLNYTIQNPSMEDNGTFIFWVQLKCGWFEQNLSVILSEEVTTASPGKVTAAPLSDVSNSPRNHQVAVIFVAIPTILGLIVLTMFCRNHKTKVSQRLNFDL